MVQNVCEISIYYLKYFLMIYHIILIVINYIWVSKFELKTFGLD